MKSLLKQINRLNLSLLLFITACINYLGFQLYGGEEQYFAFSKHFINPDWIPDSFSLTHPAGGNLFFEIIVGYALQLISFERVAFYGRMINFLLLSIPLSLIFKQLKIKNIEALFIFQLIFLPHQSIFAGEWIFQNFEVKTLAYIFVLYAIYYLLKGRIQLSTLFSAIATLFHFLVGGWIFLFVLIYFIFQKETFKNILVSILLYGIVVLPFFIYLAKTYFINNPAVINGINTNWIYSYQRLPFHLGIFKSWNYFRETHLDGVLISLALYLLCIFYFRRFNHPSIKILNSLNIIVFTEQFLFIIIALFDRNGTLLKVYPFRTSTLSSLFIIVEILLIIKYYLSKRVADFIAKSSPFRKYSYYTNRLAYANWMNALMLVLFMIFFINEFKETCQGKNTDTPHITSSMYKMMNYIKENTSADDVFLFNFPDQPLCFHRLTEREVFVVWKFTPTKSKAIYEIYERQLWKQRVAKDVSMIDDLRKKYRVDYLISYKKLEYHSLELVRTSGNIMLYKVNNQD